MEDIPYASCYSAIVIPPLLDFSNLHNYIYCQFIALGFACHSMGPLLHLDLAGLYHSHVPPSKNKQDTKATKIENENAKGWYESKSNWFRFAKREASASRNFS